MNKQLGNGQMAEAVSDYQKVTVSGGLASECIGCKQCERVCPQHLKIVDDLKQCASALEKQNMDYN
jgi:predicted aldo/keto reductase-like oxidoreductase